MNIKKPPFVALACLALCVFAPLRAQSEEISREAAEPAKEEQLFRAGEVQLDLLGTARIHDLSDLSEAERGAGFGLNYFPWRAAGFGIEARGEGINGILIDSTAFSLIGRLPIDKVRLAPEFRIGADYGLGSRDYSVFAGVGAELRLTRNLGLAGEVRGVRPIDGPEGEHILALLKLRFTF